MKTTKRILLVLLAVTLFSSSLLVGCKKKGKETETTADSVSTTGGDSYETDQWGQRVYHDVVPDELDYGGKEVNILIRELSPGDPRHYEWTTTTTKGDQLQAEVYYRNLEIEEELGVKLNFITKTDDGTSAATMNGYITNSFAAGGEGVDIISRYHYYGTSMAIMECYKNLMHEDLKYLHLDRPYWNQNFINYAKSQDRLFVMLGDMNITAYMTTFSMYFNKQLLSNICKVSDEDMYKIVLDGEWTIEKLTTMCKDTAQLDGVDGDSEGDIYGFTSHYQVHAYDGYVAAFDIDLVKTTADGKHTLMDGTTQRKLGNAADKLVSFYRSSDVFLVGKDSTSYTQPVEYFKNGRSIFCTAAIGDSQHLTNMGDNAYGLLPLPKYDTDQENYYAGVQDSHNTVAVMYGNKDYEMISAVLELFAAKSYASVRPTLFEKVIKGKQLQDSKSVEVFNLILASTRWDFSDIYPTAVQNVRNSIWRDALRDAVYNSGDGAGSVTTAIAQNRDAINLALSELDDWLYKHY